MSGSYGPLVPNSNPSIKRRVKQKLFGAVIESVDANKYKVKFNNGLEKVCNYHSLRTERDVVGIPMSETSPSVITEGVTEGETKVNHINDVITGSKYYCGLYIYCFLIFI